MSTTVTYLFDPLCGWCYGASPAVQHLGSLKDVRLALAPTGLFSGRGARAMDANFAAFAWSNDERIEKLTGQPFTEASHEESTTRDRTGRRRWTCRFRLVVQQYCWPLTSNKILTRKKAGEVESTIK